MCYPRYKHFWYAQLVPIKSERKKKKSKPRDDDDDETTWQTSAISIRRNAFAIDASTPTMSNYTDRLERRWIRTFNFYPCERIYSTTKKALFGKRYKTTHLLNFDRFWAKSWIGSCPESSVFETVVIRSHKRRRTGETSSWNTWTKGWPGRRGTGNTCL
jgi:hypothetical protein